MELEQTLQPSKGDGTETYTVMGTYFYVSQSATLTLEGTANGENIALDEKTLEDKTLGHFTGKITTETIKGNWTSADGKRTYPFLLKRVAEYRIVQERLGRHIEVSHSYPDFLTTKTEHRTLQNQLRESLIKQNQQFFANTRKEMLADRNLLAQMQWASGETASIRYYSPKFISILIYHYEYTGGAHPNHNWSSANFVLEEGKARKVSLKEMFKSGVNYTSSLAKLLIADLRRQKAAWVLEGTFKIESVEKTAAYCFLPQGIEFHFAPYVAGSYAEGTYRVFIPYSQLKSILDPKSQKAILGS
jgi:hypothetical protein